MEISIGKDKQRSVKGVYKTPNSNSTHFQGVGLQWTKKVKRMRFVSQFNCL